MPSILFLDDEESILNTYKRIIRPLGMSGFFAQNSHQAQSIIDSNKIDLIVSDYRLEEETGLDFLKKVRETNKIIPMIIISGYAEETFIKHAMEGKIIQDYLIKPVSVQSLNETLLKYSK
jgi:two-component system response regulator VanR